eukprot:350208-Chlamydomonas_euryale.AAC.3
MKSAYRQRKVAEHGLKDRAEPPPSELQSGGQPDTTAARQGATEPISKTIESDPLTHDVGGRMVEQEAWMTPDDESQRQLQRAETAV